MAWFFLSRLVAAAIAVITLFILTRLLAPDDFARYNIIVLSGTISFYFCASWLPVSVTRFNSTPEYQGQTVAIAQGIGVASTLLLLTLTLLAALVVPSEWRGPFLLSASVAFASAVHEFGLACLRVQQRGPAFAVAAVLRPLLALLFTVAFILHGGDFRSAIAAFSLGALLPGVLAVALAARSSGFRRPSGAALRTFLRFGLPVAAVGSGALLFPLSSQLLLATAAGLTEVGFFAAASTLADRTIVMLMGTLRQATAADVFHAEEQGNDSDLNRFLESHYALLLLVSVPLLGVCLFAPDTVTRILFADGFDAGVARYLPILALAAFISGVAGSFLGFVFELRRQTLRELALTCCLLTVHVSGVAALLRIIGNEGAAYGTLVTAIAMMSIYSWYARRTFIRGYLVRHSLKVAAALGAGAPFLAAADRLGSLTRAMLCLAVGLAVMLVVLKLLRYSSLEAILNAVLGRLRRT